MTNLSLGTANPGTLVDIVPYIGMRDFGGPTNEPFNGSMDMVRIYDRVTSQSEVSQLYAEPYAGIYETQSFSRVGVAAAPPLSLLAR